MKKIVFLYKGGRKEKSQQKEFPTEFYYGFYELKQKGYRLEFLEQSDIVRDFQFPWVHRLARYQEMVLFQLGLSMPILEIIYRMPWFKVLDQLNTYDCIIACHDIMGLTLAYYKQKGWLKTRVIFMEMALSEYLDTYKSKNYVGYLLKKKRFVVY